jgi:hypothetical protein
MSKQGRRSEQIQPGRARAPETGLTDQAEAGKDRMELTGEAPGEGQAVDANAVGKYWIVIILWTVAFTSMIAFEVIGAVFRR